METVKHLCTLWKQVRNYNTRDYLFLLLLNKEKALFQIYSSIWFHVYLQAVNVHQVEFSFVRLLQDVALLNCHQVLLQVIFNFIEASDRAQFVQKN